MTSLRVDAGRNHLAGARAGAMWSAAVSGALFGLLAPDHSDGFIAGVGGGLLYGGAIGLIVGRRTWKEVNPTALLHQPDVTATAPSLSRDSIALLLQAAPLTSVTAGQTRRPLPDGFVTRQIAAGAKAGLTGGLAGVVIGAGGLLLFARNNDDPSLIALPIATGLVGYTVGSAIGVHRFSGGQGIPGSAGAAAAGAAIGMLGLAAGGLPVFVTVPLGAALFHNASREP